MCARSHGSVEKGEEVNEDPRATVLELLREVRKLREASWAQWSIVDKDMGCDPITKETLYKMVTASMVSSYAVLEKYGELLE